MHYLSSDCCFTFVTIELCREKYNLTIVKIESDHKRTCLMQRLKQVIAVRPRSLSLCYSLRLINAFVDRYLNRIIPKVFISEITP